MNPYATHSVFIAALSTNTDLMQQIGGRIYAIAIPLPEPEAANAPVPYIIVSPLEANNSETNKDDTFEGQYDDISIEIEFCAKTKEQLVAIAWDIRKTILKYFMEDVDDDRKDIEYNRPSSTTPMYDDMKPCYWQKFTYQCQVKNDLYENDEELENQAD